MSRGPCDTIRVPRERVREAFDWDDPTIYRWVLRWDRGPDRSGALVQLLGETVGLAVAPAGAALVLMWLVKLASPSVSFWVAALLAVLALGDYLGALLLRVRGSASVSWRAKAHNRPVLASIALGCLAWAIAVPGSPIGAGFAGSEAGIGAGQWALYFWEHARAVLLLDLPRLFGGRLTSISPATPGAVAAALGFRILFALGVVEMGAAGWHRLRSNRAFHATVRGAWVWCEPLAALDGELRREGKLVAPDGRPEAVRALELVKTFHHLAT